MPFSSKIRFGSCVWNDLFYYLLNWNPENFDADPDLGPAIRNDDIVVSATLIRNLLRIWIWAAKMGGIRNTAKKKLATLCFI